MDKKYAPTIAKERRIDCYPSPRNHNLVNAFSKVYEVSKSSVVDDALKMYFDAMPQDKRTMLLTNKVDNNF
jgi:hypothetical protein